jgi:hypothetical protein
MNTDFFTVLTDALLERYPDKGVDRGQITGALKTALDTESLINALAEVFRLSPKEVEKALSELGLGDMIARRQLAAGGGEGAERCAMPLCGNEDRLHPFDELFRFHSSPRVTDPVDLPAALHAQLRELSAGIAAGAAEDPFIRLYRTGTEEYFRSFMETEAPVIREEIRRLFGEKGPRYLVTTGIGANEQFCHFAAALNNRDPGRKLDWIIINAPGKLSLLPPDAREDNTLFMEFSRSSVTEETIKLHEYTSPGCRRIVFSNGGGLRKLAERDGNLALRMPDAISGRYGRNKTPILLAPMLAAGMDIEGYWRRIGEAMRAFDLSDPDSLPYVLARFILAAQKDRGTDFIYFGCGDEVLGLLADEFIQFWNEGVNKNGNDLLVSRFFGLPRDSHMNLEGVLGNRQTKLGLFLLRSSGSGRIAHPLVRPRPEFIDPAHSGLELGDEEVVLALANYRRFSEVMPSLLLEIPGEPGLAHSAVLGQLFADVTLVYSRMMGIDPGSNPEVKFVRERSAQLLGSFAAEKRQGREISALFTRAAEGKTEKE